MTQIMEIQKDSFLGSNLHNLRYLENLQYSMGPLKRLHRIFRNEFEDRALFSEKSIINTLSEKKTILLAEELADYLKYDLIQEMDTKSIPESEIQLGQMKTQRIKTLLNFFELNNNISNFKDMLKSFGEFKEVGISLFINGLSDLVYINSYKLNSFFALHKENQASYPFKPGEIVYFNNSLYKVDSTFGNIVSLKSPLQEGISRISTLDLNRENPERLIVKGLIEPKRRKRSW